MLILLASSWLPGETGHVADQILYKTVCFPCNTFTKLGRRTADPCCRLYGTQAEKGKSYELGTQMVPHHPNRFHAHCYIHKRLRKINQNRSTCNSQYRVPPRQNDPFLVHHPFMLPEKKRRVSTLSHHRPYNMDVQEEHLSGSTSTNALQAVKINVFSSNPCHAELWGKRLRW